MDWKSRGCVSAGSAVDGVGGDAIRCSELIRGASKQSSAADAAVAGAEGAGAQMSSLIRL